MQGACGQPVARRAACPAQSRSGGGLAPPVRRAHVPVDDACGNLKSVRNERLFAAASSGHATSGRASIRSPRPRPLRRRSTPRLRRGRALPCRVDPPTPDVLWTAVADRIRDDLSPMVFGAWFSTTRALALDGDVLEVGVPERVHARLDRGPLRRARAQGGDAPPTRACRCASASPTASRAAAHDGDGAAPAEPESAKPQGGKRARRAEPGRAAALQVHVRLVRDRQLEPLRARGRAGRRRGARARPTTRS